MNDRLRKFMGKPQTFKHPSGETLTLSPFKGKDLDLLMALSENVKGEEINNLVFKALKGTELECSMEEVEEADVSFLTWVSECISEVNGTKK